MLLRLRRLVYQVIEGGHLQDWRSQLFDSAMVMLILLNVLAVALETVQPLWQQYKALFQAFEAFSVTVFTIEYVARIWVSVEHRRSGSRVGAAARRFEYALTPYALIDLLAILPFYLSAYLFLDLRFLRVFRLLRLLKLARYSPALGTLTAAIYTERRALMAALLIMLALLVFSGSAMYFIERTAQPDTFSSIPAAMWWALATLTTVGYGDIVPITPLGKLFGSIVAILGLAMYALPIGIMASAFINEIRRRDFVVTWGMVARVPLFADLDARSIAQIAGLLHSRVVSAGEIVVARGEKSNAMYFIVDGEVEVEASPRPVRLGVDDFFGEMGLLRDSQRAVTVRAVTDCQLMVLSRNHFRRLLASKPALRERLERVAAERAEQNAMSNVQHDTAVDDAPSP